MSDLPRPDEGGPVEVFGTERVSATPPAPIHEAGEPRPAPPPHRPRGRARRRPVEDPPPVTWSLAETQRWFLDALLRPGDPARVVADAARRAGAAPASILGRGPHLDVAARFGVYHDAYRLRLREALADDYPAVRHVLGAARFDTLCDEVIAASPSTGPNLNRYGRVLLEHLRRPGRRLPHRAFCAELAALEWALVEAVHAAPPPALPREALAALPHEAWARARFLPSPALTVLHTAYPVNPWFQRWREDRAPPVPRRRASTVAVYRVGFRLWRMDLSPVAAGLLGRLLAGETLGAALAGVESEAGAPQVMRWFAAWVQGGFFAGVEVAP